MAKSINKSLYFRVENMKNTSSCSREFWMTFTLLFSLSLMNLGKLLSWVNITMLLGVKEVKQHNLGIKCKNLRGQRMGKRTK